MKANKAPEKVYLLFNRPYLVDYSKLNKRRCKEEVEYVRLDAFIEKADKFISSFFHPDDTELKKGILDEFHKYMKGE